MAEDQAELLTELALKRLSDRYAQAVDAGDGEQFASLFTPDGVVEAPRGRFAGNEALRGVPPMMRERYLKTFHAVFSPVYDVTGDTASGQLCCLARHYLRDLTGQYLCYEMTVRYHDAYVRTPDGWRIASRKLELLGTQTFAAKE